MYVIVSEQVGFVLAICKDENGNFFLERYPIRSGFRPSQVTREELGIPLEKLGPFMYGTDVRVMLTGVIFPKHVGLLPDSDLELINELTGEIQGIMHVMQKVKVSA